MAKDSFILYDIYGEQINLLSDEECGQLLKAIFSYRKGETPPSMSTATNILFVGIRAQIDRDNAKYKEKCEQNAINGKKGAEFGKLGGRPKKESYNDIIDNAEVTPSIAEKLKVVLQWSALNKRTLTNEELRLIIDLVKQRDGESEQSRYIDFILTCKPNEILG